MFVVCYNRLLLFWLIMSKDLQQDYIEICNSLILISFQISYMCTMIMNEYKLGFVLTINLN